MEKPIAKKLKTAGKCFIPAGTELVDVHGNIHVTTVDQTITRKDFGIITDMGTFIPNTFTYIN